MPLSKKQKIIKTRIAELIADGVPPSQAIEIASAVTAKKKKRKVHRREK